MSMCRAQKLYVIGYVKVKVGFHESKVSRQWCVSEWECKLVNS